MKRSELAPELVADEFGRRFIPNAEFARRHRHPDTKRNDRARNRRAQRRHGIAMKRSYLEQST